MPSVNENEQVVVKEDEYRERYGFNDKFEYKFKTKKGLSEEIVREISTMKGEPDWMLEKRLTGYKQFLGKPTPQWGGNLNEIDYNDIYYYLKPTDKKGGNSWDSVPKEIKDTFDKLGIPEAERKFFAGAEAQYDSEVVYSHIREDLAKEGVVFISTDEAVKEYPEIMKKYFGTVIPPSDNKFAALNTAVWSGGCLTEDTFIFTSNPGGKNIKNIEEGDTVFALSDENKIVPAKVLGKIYSGNKEVLEFRVAGRTIKATKNHKFLALIKEEKSFNKHGKKWRRVWKSLGDLKEGDFIAISKKLPEYGKSYKLPLLEPYAKRQRHLEKTLNIKETNEDLLWFLGILLGDGNVYWPNENMCFINIALPLSDPSRNEALRVVKELFSMDVVTQNSVSFTIHSKALGGWFKKLGVTGKAKTKSVPHWVFGLPKAQRLAFLGGLLDSDGYMDSNAGAVVRFELANRVLIEQIKLLSISCGLFSDGKILERKRNSIFKKESRKIYSGTCYSCRISGNVNEIKSRSSKMVEKLKYRKSTFDKYTTVTGENFTSETNEYIGFAPIKDLQSIGNRDVYDIQVEDHANFIANGVVAHNSFIYVPKGVKVKMPLQAYFRINSEKAGQFERTLIIADEGAEVTYVEGCFVKGTLIDIEGGSRKPIEQITIGDGVFTHLNRYRRVYHTQVRPYTGKLFKIKYGSVVLNVTAEHPFLINTPEGTKWISAKDLNMNSYLTLPKTNTANELKHIESGKGSYLVQNILEYEFVKISEISFIEVKDIPVYNFSVEDDESYVAEGVIVHNCTAPIYMSSSLHSAVVELVAHKNATIKYVTIQNWSKNVYNLVTQRAFAYENASVTWIDGNIGSKLNMKYPSVYLKERGAKGEILSIAIAGPDQVQDSGGKIYHLAPDTTSQIVSKSVSSGNGSSTYRGLLHIGKDAANVKSSVRCDALLLDKESKTNTYPYMEVNREDATITHEASTGKVGEEQLFYLMSRGLSEEEALTTIVLGFIDPLARALPLEYSLELRRLIKLDMSNSVG